MIKEIPQNLPVAGLSEKLGVSNSGSTNIETSDGLSNSISLFASSNTLFPNKILSRGEEYHRRGGHSDDPKRCNKRGFSFRGSAFESNICCSKERFWVQTSNKPETSEFTRGVPPFQNGRTSSSERSLETRGCDVQTRSKGCVLLSTSPGVISTVCTFSVGSQNLPISLPLFWSRPCSKDIHKTNENTYCNTQATQHETDYISQRHSVDGNNRKGTFSGKRYLDISPTIFRFPDKHQEIPTESNPKDSIFRGEYRFNQNGSESTSGEIGKDSLSMSGYFRKEITVSEGTGLYCRETIFNSYCGSPGTIAIPIPSKETMEGH